MNEQIYGSEQAFPDYMQFVSLPLHFTDAGTGQG
jgi:hypothetical protein